MSKFNSLKETTTTILYTIPTDLISASVSIAATATTILKDIIDFGITMVELLPTAFKYIAQLFKELTTQTLLELDLDLNKTPKEIATAIINAFKEEQPVHTQTAAV